MRTAYAARLSKRLLNSTAPSQATASLTAVMMTVLAARSAAPAVFGVFAVAQVSVMFAIGLQRAALLTPVLLHINARVPAPVKELRKSVLLVGAFVAAASAGVSAATSGPLSAATLAIAIAVPPNLYWDSLRAHYQGVQNYRTLAYGEGVSFVTALVWFSVVAATSPSLMLFVLGLAVAPALASIATVPPWSSKWASWKRRWPTRDSRNLFADYLLYTGLDQLIVLLAGLYLSVLAVGALRLAQTALGPITVILLALETYMVAYLRDVPMTARSKLRLAYPRFVAVAVLGLTAGLVLTASTPLAVRVFGESWRAAQPIVLALAARQAVSALNMIPTLALLTSGRTSTIIRCRFLTAPLITAGTLAELTWRPDLVLFAWVFASLHLIASLVLWTAVLHPLHPHGPLVRRSNMGSPLSIRPKAAITTWGQWVRCRVRSWRARQRRFQVLRTVPENAQIKFRTKAELLLQRLIMRAPILSRRARQRHAKHFTEDVQLLNDVLATTSLRGRYWMWGGLLLGWAREGGVLSHDVGDADFLYPGEAEDQFEDAFQALRDAGFQQWFCYRRSEDGRLAERVFVRRGSKFEFFTLYDVPGGQCEYHVFGNEGTDPVEYIGRFPRLGLETFRFLDRTWLKPVDHDGFLTRQYGDWRVPKSDWNFAQDDRSIVRRRSWEPQQIQGRSHTA